MSLDPEKVYGVMSAAFHHGVLDRILEMTGAALERALAETSLEMVDLLEKMDGVGEGTLRKIDRVLSVCGVFLSVAASDHFMRIISRLLDFAFVRRFVELAMRKLLVRTLGEGQAKTHHPGSARVIFAGGFRAESGGEG